MRSVLLTSHVSLLYPALLCNAYLQAVCVCVLPHLSPAPTDTISELKLGNGTSVLIFANIASSLPTSVGALLAQNTESDPGNIAIYAVAFFLTTLGIIYVQEAERRIPVNYSSRYQAGNLARQSYLPFKVNATGGFDSV